MAKKMLFILIAIACNASFVAATLKLTSPALSHNEEIPTQYTCNGKNISPALAWSDAPEGTQSFALIVKNPSTDNNKPSTEPLVHWILFNIPLTVEYITENQGATGEEVPFLQGINDFGTQKWSGPCPSRGIHHYHFTLYALDTMLNLPAGATKKDLLSAMHGHILEKTTLIGTYPEKK